LRNSLVHRLVGLPCDSDSSAVPGLVPFFLIIKNIISI
jgi:hypothetical protein